MQPKTKQQKEVMELYKKLPELTSLDIEDAKKKLAPHIAKHDSKGYFYCLDCGHVWKGKKESHVICPQCGKHLQLDAKRWRVQKDKYYIMKITTCGAYQVLRTFLAETKIQKGKKLELTLSEVYQRWISPKGNNIIVGHQRSPLGYYVDRWNWDSDFELRREHQVHCLTPYLSIGKIRLIPVLKRNGLKGSFRRCDPNDLINGLIKDNRIETLWKMKRYDLARHALRSNFFLDKCWKSLKVALRHKYEIEDISLWEDLVSSLKEIGKDVTNPALICPQNLKEAHDKAYAKLTRVRRQRRILEEKERFYKQAKEREEREAKYKEAKQKYFGLIFSDGEISISPLKSVEDFLIEGASQNHCVYTNAYYLKDESLILHATLNGHILATIEFSLNDMSIVQCRGKSNSIPEHKDRIVSLIKNNIDQIARCKMAS